MFLVTSSDYTHWDSLSTIFCGVIFFLFGFLDDINIFLVVPYVKGIRDRHKVLIKIRRLFFQNNTSKPTDGNFLLKYIYKIYFSDPETIITTKRILLSW